MIASDPCFSSLSAGKPQHGLARAIIGHNRNIEAGAVFMADYAVRSHASICNLPFRCETSVTLRAAQEGMKEPRPNKRRADRMEDEGAFGRSKHQAKAAKQTVRAPKPIEPAGNHIAAAHTSRNVAIFCRAAGMNTPIIPPVAELLQ